MTFPNHSAVCSEMRAEGSFTRPSSVKSTVFQNFSYLPSLSIPNPGLQVYCPRTSLTLPFPTQDVFAFFPQELLSLGILPTANVTPQEEGEIPEM